VKYTEIGSPIHQCHWPLADKVTVRGRRGARFTAGAHDLRWSPIQMARIEGRCHRDGHFAQVFWAYANGTIESKPTRRTRLLADADALS
jgi:hypothetical protein